jgi:nondiscriminating glutamyl-tRNA synthetase
MGIVTRFAPSPTGYVHIWSLRTVLYNYLFTKQNDGKFLLRIEDTDRSRYVEGSVENLMHVLASVWLIADEGPNNPGDKGPYFQSERLDIYQEHIKKLLDDDKAYYCFCTSERLTELREEQQSLGLPTKYDKKCRYLTPEEVQEKLDAGTPHTIRLKVPDNTEITFEDAVRWKITIPSKDVDDQVLMKTDGFPTYHFAVVVDDYLMGVTDIIRGDEWIPSTPKHVLLYNAFGWEMPRFSHVPPLLGEGWKKLSKRTGDVSVESFLAKWFLPEAMLNYISLLGWNPKTTEEIFSMQELIERFKLSDVHRAGAIFEEARMEW